MVAARRKALTPDEALQLHHQALVIDSQQPGATHGCVLQPWASTPHKGSSETGSSPFCTPWESAKSSPPPRRVPTTWTCGKGQALPWPARPTQGRHRPTSPSNFLPRPSGGARAIIDALAGEIRLVRTAADIEQVYSERKRGIIFDFQDTTPFGSDLDRIDFFYDLGLRVVQLTYNRRNLVGDGCTERYKTGLTYFGCEVVERLNERRMAVDVSHCSEQVGWDALEISTAPILVSHSASSEICFHDRGKSDPLARAIAEKGGFFGVAAIAGFLHEGTLTTLDRYVDHVEHLVDVMGIDHVGIGTDKCGPGPGTESYIEFPDEYGPFDTSHLYKEDADPRSAPTGFDWTGFRSEHRLSDQHRIADFDKFDDWPNITVQLAERGFNEEELRKLLGLNYLRYFRDVVG